MTSQELVLRTLEGRNTTGRAPRQLGYLPWAYFNYPQELKRILATFPDDIAYAGGVVLKKAAVRAKGDMHEVGTATDAWGCEFVNIQRGIIGEVKNPLVTDDEWEDADNVHIPEELLSFDVKDVNDWIAKNRNGKFLFGGCCPRPFEQLQFIRGTENLYMDLMYRPKKLMDFIEKMHDFYCRHVEKWSQTDCDAITFMDDWGSQRSLLISPKLWDELFAPMYRKYIEIAHNHGKKVFMHSDGYTMAIIPRLIDMGLDALNTQIFCMGPENLKQFKGKITFWGEIDRQELIPRGTITEIDEAVQCVYDNLWQDGCCIAQCEFGPAANPDNVYRIFEKWNELTDK